ncbi:MAG: potassium channel protein, partial [Candidatus Omnitrophota bacterium]
MKKISLAFLLLLFLVSLGTFGYIYIEGFSFLESLYMTVITISTVGFQELRPLSWQGKLFTIFLIIGSVGIFAYAVTIIGNFLIEGHLTFISRRKKMQKQLEFLKKHYIICGINRVAKEAI